MTVNVRASYHRVVGHIQTAHNFQILKNWIPEIRKIKILLETDGIYPLPFLDNDRSRIKLFCILDFFLIR
jgi:hypothetical protein